MGYALCFFHADMARSQIVIVVVVLCGYVSTNTLIPQCYGRASDEVSESRTQDFGILVAFSI